MEQLALELAASTADHLRFAESLMETVAPQPARRAKWAADIRRARQRLTDRTTYQLAVVGQFNAGKSTFINAVLEAELFASASRETTSAVVRVRYGQRLVVRVRFRDGTTWMSTAVTVDRTAAWRRQGPPPEADWLGVHTTTAEVRAALDSMPLLDALRVVTADPTVASRVEAVDVDFPSPLLSTGLVLVDTPGVGSGDREHSESHVSATKVAIAETDATVVVIRAGVGFGEDLGEFITATFDRGLIGRCAFVLTGADQLDADELDDAVQDVTSGARRRLGLARVPVALTAPAAVVDVLRGRESGLDDIWVRRFAETRRWLRDLAEARRPHALADSSLRLTQDLVAEVEHDLTAALAEVEDGQRKLAAAAHQDLTAVLARHLADGRTAVADIELALRGELGRLAATARTDLVTRITGLLADCKNGSAIKRVLGEAVPPAVDERLAALNAEAEELVRARFEECLAAVRSRLAKTFEAEHAKLTRLGTVPPLTTATVTGAPVSTADTRGLFAPATQVAVDDLRRDVLSLGAIPACMAIGSVVPGFGTLIGGVVGFVVAMVLTSSPSTVRAKAADKATVAAGSLVDTAEAQLRDSAVRYADMCRVQLDVIASFYSRAYADTVNAMHAAHLAENQRLRARRTELTAAKDEVARRGAALTAQRDRLLSATPHFDRSTGETP